MERDPSTSPRFLPVGLDLHGTSCVVIGGGQVGTRKARTLVGAGALVTVIAPAITDDLHALLETGTVRWVREPFQDMHLAGTFLAVAATNDDTVNATIVRLARARGVLVCDASSAERSQVIFGALLHTDGRTIAVFTGGSDPADARTTRDRLASIIARGKRSHD